MRVHELKTWPEPFAAVLDGRKRYEVRQDDRGYAVGDVLHLREFHVGQMENYYTGRELRVRVTYMTDGGDWGLPSRLCVMSIDPEPPAFVDDESRCAVCGWTLDGWTTAWGCKRGNCSQRPVPERLYAPERAAKEREGVRACRHRAVRYFWIGFAWGRLEMGETAKHKADAAICQHCGHWLPLGLARDDERTAVEVAAAGFALVHAETGFPVPPFNGCVFDLPFDDCTACQEHYLAAAICAHHDEQSKEGM